MGRTSSRRRLGSSHPIGPPNLGVVPGFVVLVRRRIPVSTLLAMPVVITVTAAMTFGITRYRVPVDAMLVVAAAVAIDWVIGRRWPPPDDGTITRLRGRRTTDDDAPSEAADEPEPASA